MGGRIPFSKGRAGGSFMEFSDQELLEIVDALDAHISCIGGMQKEKLAIHDRIKEHLESKGYVVAGGE